MESSFDSCIYLDLESYDVISVVKLQAAIRGHLVRRKMKELRNTYLGIVHVIETNKHLTVTWSGPKLSNPKFVTCKKMSKNTIESKSGFRTVAVNTSVCDMDTIERNVKSVEIQTADYREEMTGRMNSPRVDSLNNANDVHLDTGTSNELRSEATFPKLEVNDPKYSVPEKLESGAVKHFDNLELKIPLEDEDGGGTSSFTEVTSLWESPSEAGLKTDLDNDDDVKNVDSSSILEVRKNLAMELLWVQQAINSRKNYLKLKSQME